MLIKEVTFNNRKVSLCGDSPNEQNNVFTLVVGRNGCGKSVLFKKICQITIHSVLNKNPGPSHHLNFDKDPHWAEIGSIEYTFENKTNIIEINNHNNIIDKLDLRNYPETEHQLIRDALRHRFPNEPTVSYQSSHSSELNDFTNPKIIAVSASPFDKFPLAERTYGGRFDKDLRKHYIYRGAKTNNNSKTYLKSKLDQLGASFINFFLKHEDRKSEILPLFEYLGVSSKFKITLRTSDLVDLKEIISQENNRNAADIVSSLRFRKGSGASEQISQEEQHEIISAAKATLKNSPPPPPDAFPFETLYFEFELDIQQNSNSKSNDQPLLLKEMSVLAKFDLIELDDIEFKKTNTKAPFLLSEASSGELCILFNILAIAAEITDNTIILLDEPELSLHPEWQQDFLPLLSSVFMKYKKCHFIIATHSPQIVSAASNSNSYIVDLESNPAKILEGREVHNQSLDYQLVHIFKAPGNRNEYLISKAVEALTAIRDGQIPDASFLNEVENLIELYKIVPNNDPVQKLLTTLKKAVSIITK